MKNHKKNQNQKKIQLSLSQFATGERVTVSEQSTYSSATPSPSVAPLNIEKEIEETSNPFRKIWLNQESMRKVFNSIYK